ncbi:MAG TPA: glycosyltransferase family 4 protein [Sedimentisphaerales bacterium]|nr:glycosyltransferase family 4 protein [Sedimentisphaerales bacterium]
MSGVNEVIVVTDTPQQPIEGVTLACPPRWLRSISSRAGAKLIWMLIIGVHRRPDIYMGYHIFPSAISALCIARLLNRPACYQDTSGPTELQGGGWRAENRVLAGLGAPSRLIGTLVSRVVREFDLVVVRGTKAAAFIREIGYSKNLAIVTGSVQAPGRWHGFAERECDLIFVGRLTECKRPDRFVSIVAGVAKRLPAITARVVGDGPQMVAVRQQARTMGIEDRLTFLGKREDVSGLLGRSRVYVLTSRSEGLSIAMIEAMANGAVPVVSDVGDLRDLVSHGVNGFVVAEEALDCFCDTVTQLLVDESAWKRCSLAAVQSATAYSGLERVSERWREELGRLTRFESAGLRPTS